MKKNLRSLLFASLALLATGATAAPGTPTAAVPTDLKLILCVGQSNMAGRGKVTDADRAPVANAWKLDASNNWVAACSPYHFDRASAGVGPVDEFVRRYLADHPGEHVGVVPCAVGGSGSSAWQDSDKGKRGAFLRNALARAKIAATNGTFIAVLWLQGEADAAKSDAERLMKVYPARIAGAMKRIRRELDDENLPVVVGEIGRWMRKDGDHAARINPAIHAIPSLLPRCAVVSSEGLVNQDRHHFDRASQLTLGARFYDAWRMLNLTKQK